MDNGVTMIEMNIPGHKAGLVIGKSGETIKQLQVKVASICGGVTEVEVPLLTVYIWGLVFIY
jgi:ribosomal protein S3